MTWLQCHLASAERRFADATARLERRLALLQNLLDMGRIDQAMTMRSEIDGLRQEIVYREAILATVQACVRRRTSLQGGLHVPPMSRDEMLKPLRAEIASEPADKEMTTAI
jgi:hypothetical protein